MKRVTKILGPVFAPLMFSQIAQAQVPIAAPTYFNFYWDRSGTSWDAGVAAAASTAPKGSVPGPTDISRMTRDMIDSLLESTLLSQWPQDLAKWGVTPGSPVPWSFEITPEDETSGPAAHVCPGVTPKSDFLADWEANLQPFVNCAIEAATAATATTHPEVGLLLSNPQKVVFNVFIPPFVGMAPDGGDPCLSGSEGGDDEGYFSYNELVDGYTVAILPTEPNCASGLNTNLFYSMTHEDAEASAAGTAASLTPPRQLCDPCEPQALPFLGYKGPAEYAEYGPTTSVKWVPVPGGTTQAPKAFDQN